MLIQKNANINVMAHQELKSDVETLLSSKELSQEKKHQELKWRPVKTVKEQRKVAPLFQVCSFAQKLVGSSHRVCACVGGIHHLFHNLK